MSTKDPSPTPVVPVLDGQPKRVILRLRCNEFDFDDDEAPKEAIQVYLNAAGRDMAECNNLRGRHNWHAQVLLEDHGRTNPKASFHVVLDLEKDAVGTDEPNMDGIPHEIYRVRRGKDGKLCVHQRDPALATGLPIHRELTATPYYSVISRLPDRWLPLARSMTDGFFKWGQPWHFVGCE